MRIYVLEHKRWRRQMWRSGGRCSRSACAAVPILSIGEVLDEGNAEAGVGGEKAEDNFVTK